MLMNERAKAIKPKEMPMSKGVKVSRKTRRC
jgi:hypothetical protein